VLRSGSLRSPPLRTGGRGERNENNNQYPSKGTKFISGLDRSDALELLVFGKDKEPLVTLPLKRMDAPQELPLDFTAERTGDAGCLTIRILGKYEAKLMVTELGL
jgi:hypothetical protein